MIKLILTLMVATFMSVASVNAEAEISCSTSKNLLKLNNFVQGNPTDIVIGSIGYYTYSYNGYIQVKPSTAYHYANHFTTSSTPRRVAVVFYGQDFKKLSYLNDKVTSSYHDYSFTTPDNAYYITLHLYTVNFATLNSSPYQLEEGSSKTDYVDYEQCPVEEPEPEPEPIIPDTTLDNFYSIYVTKLKELSDFSIENKFVLSAFVIVLIFALLALFIHLFGRRKPR